MKLQKIMTLPLVMLSLCNCINLNAAASYGDNLSFEDQVVWLVNQERAANGLSLLYASVAINEAAEIRSQELTKSFLHTRPDGRSGFSILDDRNIDWSCVGENIAWGYATPEAVVKSWMSSEGHRSNILNPNYQYIGVGYVDGNYWTQLFIGGVTREDAYLPEKSQTLLGDVNQDGVVNAADASQILIEAAAIGAGKNASFTQVQNYSADVNGDGSINAGDASFILQYAAYQGVGGTDALPVFIEEGMA